MYWFVGIKDLSNIYSIDIRKSNVANHVIFLVYNDVEDKVLEMDLVSLLDLVRSGNNQLLMLSGRLYVMTPLEYELSKYINFEGETWNKPDVKPTSVYSSIGHNGLTIGTHDYTIMRLVMFEDVYTDNSGCFYLKLRSSCIYAKYKVNTSKLSKFKVLGDRDYSI